MNWQLDRLHDDHIHRGIQNIPGGTDGRRKSRTAQAKGDYLKTSPSHGHARRYDMTFLTLTNPSAV
jgi:hypothetical protein